MQRFLVNNSMLLTRGSFRSYAAPAKGAAAAGGKAKAGKKTTAEASVINPVSANVGDKVPIGVEKAGGDPVIKPDSEYPAYLWTALNSKNIDDLEKSIQENGMKSLSFADKKRYVQIKNKLKITEKNTSSGTV